MRDKKYRQQQWDDRWAPRIAPVNALVDELMVSPGQAGVPYFAPIYGGVDARVLFVARDPGPKTQSELGGSGFLSLENDDASAERFATLLDDAGIPVGETLPWNAYPWYINRPPQAAEVIIFLSQGRFSASTCPNASGSSARRAAWSCSIRCRSSARRPGFMPSG
jgi:hypothetical protein